MDKIKKVIKTYNAAADSFDKKPLSFWNFFGQKTVDLANLRQGDSVLDVCCGSGASALPAAREVGKEGLVIGVDLSERLLQLGQSKADAAGLDWIYFIQANMEQIKFPRHRFHAVMCVFGIFFFEDMERQLANLWRLVKPTGKIGITTWGSNIFSPVSEIWNEELSKIRMDLVSDFQPWDNITTEKGLKELFFNTGIETVRIVSSQRKQILNDPEDFWTIAMGSGFRWIIEQLTPEERIYFKTRLLSKVRAHGINSIETNALIAVAQKPPARQDL
ncbi:class I SAM-dependent methyltransferase [Poritiphilus flavus]|uniref:Class I SAM-dependent methyltransferase n=1 Tax=Poritiphilus flavus TaxID=2697053 RepID=A0A6L9EC63_9FLAO|nr:class I SAM-dependent methyltransferase [Poritiphilus flavus]NAS12233.1 class I SAM-dependent methyltransferase [Poritiphilus flavus]